MKVSSIMIISICLIIHKYHEVHEYQSGNWYAQQVDKKNSNYIELITNGDSISGFFYGVERLPDRTLLFYKSTLDSVKVRGQKINFKLTKFSISRQAFDRGMPNAFVSPDDAIVPFDLRQENNYFGNKYSTELRLQRTLVAYDNRADQAVFKKVPARD
jgi:hypothetical protein